MARRQANFFVDLALGDAHRERLRFLQIDNDIMLVDELIGDALRRAEIAITRAGEQTENQRRDSYPTPGFHYLRITHISGEPIKRLGEGTPHQDGIGKTMVSALEYQETLRGRQARVELASFFHGNDFVGIAVQD